MQKVKMDDFAGFKFLSGLDFSPDGEHACFAVHQADLEENRYRSNLWICRVKEERCFQLTAFDREKGFIWLDDSEHVLFPGARDPGIKERQEAGEELTVYYQISIYGGEAREAFRIPLKVKSILQVDRERFLFVAETVYGGVFFYEMQYFAALGYYVFYCNPRGSDGKGNAFADIRGRYGTVDYEDLMAFTDAVLERCPQIDRERVAVAGGSYGGFMTNWIIGHTDRFKAAVSQRCVSNWVTMHLTSDIGYLFEPDQIGATPWSDMERLWAQSPLKYADRVKTPTLFIHADEDYRCWLPEGLQMFSALKYHGAEARLCLFQGENHELSRSGRPRQRLRRLHEIAEWFGRHLAPER